MNHKYTIKEYQAAKDSVSYWSLKFEGCSANNQNKYRTEITNAKIKLHDIELALKQSGQLTLTPQEVRDNSLNAIFPNARSNQLVEWQGVTYKRIFTPLATSLSGKTVKRWLKTWDEVKS